MIKTYLRQCFFGLLSTGLLQTPALAQTVDAQHTQDQTPEITGTAHLEPGEKLVVVVGGLAYSPLRDNLFLDEFGNWKFRVAEALPGGTYDIDVYIIGSKGDRKQDNSTDELVINAPSYGETVDSGGKIEPISGQLTLKDGDRLAVLVDGLLHSSILGNLEQNNKGGWTLIPTAPPIGDQYEVVIKVIHSDGSFSNYSETEGLIDPDELLNDYDSPAAPTLTVDGGDRKTAIGTGEPGALIFVTNADVTIGQAFVDPAGNWTTPLSPIPISGDIIDATQSDSSGNKSSESSYQLP